MTIRLKPGQLWRLQHAPVVRLILEVRTHTVLALMGENGTVGEIDNAYLHHFYRLAEETT